MEDKYSYDDIEQYLEGTLEGKERAVFEKKLTQDTGLQEKVAFFRQLQNTVMKVEDEEDFAAVVSGVDKDLGQRSFFENKTKKGHTPAKISKLWRRMAIAASIFLALWAGMMFWSDQNYSNEALVAANFQPYEITNVPNRGTGDNLEQRSLALGISAYNDQNFEEALEQFRKITNDQLEFAESRFYIGQVHLAQGSWESAIDQFQASINANDLRFKEIAEWYSVMARLRANQPQEQIIASLDAIIAKEGHPYYDRASRLKGQLTSFWRKF